MNFWQGSLCVNCISYQPACDVCSLFVGKKVHGTYMYTLANNYQVPMLLLSRLRNVMLPGYKEILLLQEGCQPRPCALVGPALALFHGTESVGPVGHACLEPEPFHGRPYVKDLGTQNFLPKWPRACVSPFPRIHASEGGLGC